MLFNNFRFILRRFSRQKLHTTLHIIGLTIGLTVCLIIGLYLQHELSYDNYHEKADRIYRVNQVWSFQGKKELDYATPFPLAKTIREEIPSVEYATIIHPVRDPNIEITPQKRFRQDRVLLAEPYFLDIFDVEILQGNGHEALRTPYQALLTESTAEKFFGRENPMGKTFLYNEKFTITVAGIIRDLPDNTHLPATMLLSYVYDNDFIGTRQDSWSFTSGSSTYITLPEETSPDNINAALKTIYAQNANTDPEELERAGATLQALHRIHFEPKWGGGGRWVKAIYPSWLWFFGGIGLVILILAAINFINLSTAQALTRAREVGVRKAIGANRKQLLGQFLGEAFFLILLSSALAIVVNQIALPYLNDLLDKELHLSRFITPGFITLFLLGLLLTGFLTGIYPAWLISRFQPASSLKTGFSAGDKTSSTLRKSLVITQFTISIALLVALMLISQQMEFFQNKNLGFDKENVVTMRIPDVTKRTVFATELEKIPQVKDISFALTAPSGNGGRWGTDMHKTNLGSPDVKEVNIVFADENYFQLYDLQLLAGKFYTATDTNALIRSTPGEQLHPKVIVNERLVKEMGYPSSEAALGEQFLIGINNWKVDIVGVVADFNLSSLHEAIEPTLITQYNRFQNNASIKISPSNNLPETLALIESAWKKAYPNGIYKFDFLDEHIARYYESENKLFGLFKIFAGLAMLISCLGLWGLATFSTIQRTKEIGIRKILGASVVGILSLLSKDFLKLVAIALIIAIPIAWYGMNQWLQNFAYQIEIRWSVFILAGILAISIAFLTISFQSLKAALANPIRALRNE